MLTFATRLTLSSTACSSIASGLAKLSAQGFLILLVVLPSTSWAQDSSWPQILGPGRDGQAINGSVDASKWAAKAKPEWQYEVGAGFAGVAIEKGKVIAFHRQGNEELLTAIDINTGQKIWEQSWTASYQARINPDNGPRCVPTIASDKVVCYGAAGDTHCVSLEDGKKLWSRPLRKEYKAQDGYFGAGSSPLIVDNQVIVCLGGREAGIVSLDLNTGKTQWKSTEYDSSYAAPVLVPSTGGKRVLVVTRLRTVLLDRVSGEVIDEIAFGQRGPTVNAATPIRIAKGTFLLTASYGIGATLLQVTENSLRAVYEGESVLSSQYNTPVLIKNRVVGVDGREDGAAGLVAFDPVTLETFWNLRNTGTANLLAVNDRVLSLALDGKLTYFDPSGDALKEIGVTQLPAGTYRSLPAVTNKGLVVRNNTSTYRSTISLYKLD